MIARGRDRIGEIPEPVSENDLKSDCVTVARLIMYGLIEVKRIKVNTTVIAGPAADLYRKEDDHPSMTRMYKCFEEFPMLLQFCAWFSAEGKDAPGAMALTMDRYKELRERLSEKEDADGETDIIKAVATEWRGKLEELKNNVMMAYADHALDRAAYDLCTGMIGWMSQEFGSFIRTW